MSLNIRDVYNKKQQQETGGRSISEVYKNKKEEQENTQEDSKSSRSISNVYKEKTAQDTAWNIAERANKWVTDVNNLRSDYITRFGAENAGYRGDATDYFNSIADKTTALNTEAESILALIKEYGDYYDDDWKQSVTDMLSATSLGRRQMNDIVMRSYEDQQFWSKWKSEDDYLTNGVPALQNAKYYAEYGDMDENTYNQELEKVKEEYNRSASGKTGLPPISDNIQQRYDYLKQYGEQHAPFWYNLEDGQKRIERLKYYKDEYEKLAPIANGNPSGSLNSDEWRASQEEIAQAKIALDALYQEYAKEFGVESPLGDKPDTFNDYEEVSLSNGTPQGTTPYWLSSIDFEKELADEEERYSHAKFTQEYNAFSTVKENDDFATGVSRGKELARIPKEEIQRDAYGKLTPSEFQAAKIALYLKEQGFDFEDDRTFDLKRALFPGDVSAFSIDERLIKKYFVTMKDDEFNTLAYLLADDEKNGTNRAEEYVKAINNDVYNDDSINKRKGRYDFENSALKDSALLQRFYVIPAGLDQFASGMKNIFNDEYTPSSPTQYTSMYAKEALADNGLKYYNAKTGHLETVKIFGQSTAQLFYDATTSAVNMAPAIAVGAIVEAALPTVGEGALVAGALLKSAPKLLSAATMGASAGGNAKNEMLGLGYDEDTANIYGLLVAASEAGLEYLIGKIPGISSGGGIFSTLGEKAIGTIDNALAKVSITLAKNGIKWVASGLDEALEEGLQTVLETWFKEMVTGVDFEDPSAEEIAYSSLLGFLMGAGFDVGRSSISGLNNTVTNISTGKSFKTQFGIKGVDNLVTKGMEFDGTSAQYQAKKIATKLEKGKTPSAYSVGKLKRNVSDAQMKAEFQSAIGDSKIANTLTDIVKGRNVSDGDLQGLLENTKALSLLNNIIGTNISKEYSLDTARNVIAKVFKATEGKKPVESKVDRNRVVKSLAVNLNPDEANRFADIITDIVNGNNDLSDKSIKAVLQNKYARNALNKYLERTVEDKFTESSKASDVRAVMAEGNYSRQGQAVLFGSTLGMSGNAIKGLSAVVANSHADVASIARAYNVVYKAAKSGKALADVSGVEALSPTQKLIAYEYGVMDGLVEQSESKKKATEEAEDTEESTAKETNEEAEISLEGEVPEGAIVTKGGETIMPVKENTKEQTRIIDMGKKLGVEVAFGKITKNGKNIDGLFDGKVLYINPKTTSGNAAYILFKHEFTHFLEKSTKYINFAIEVTESKAFSEWLKKKGFKNSAEHYAKIIADYKQIGKNLEMGGAQKEAVANFCAEMLYAKDDSMQRFVDTLSADHKRTFGELVRDFIEWIKKKLGKVDEIAMLEKKYAEVFKTTKGLDADTADAGKTALLYVGKNAKTADLFKLETAQRMIADGVDSETVRKETGWFKGYDGEWRFEIDDFESSLIEYPQLERHEDDGDVYFTGKLSDIFDHKDLFAAYPDMNDINIVIQKTDFGVDGIYQPRSNYITLSIEQFKRYTKAYSDHLNGGRKTEIAEIEASEAYKEYNRFYDDEIVDAMEPMAWLEAEEVARDKFFSSDIGKRYYQLMWGKENGFSGDKFELGWGKAAKAVLLHEIQHAVQNREGFASGTNTRDANYDRNAGEIEARDVANRADLTAEERKNTLPDIDREDVVFADKSSVSYFAANKENYSKVLKNNNESDIISTEYSYEEGYHATDEFRKLQEESRGMSTEEIQMYHSGDKEVDAGVRANIARILQSQIESHRNGLRNDYGLLSLTAKGSHFDIYEGVNPSLFHDCFEIAQKYLRNGELVTLHDVKTTTDDIGYEDCYNYLSKDGLSGFAITPKGDLISVFNASGKAGFLNSIAPIVKERAMTLDCYNSPLQPLMAIYSKVLGFKPAAIMDHNMEFDHDNIAVNHNYPKVAFMVNTDAYVKTKEFNKDQYEQAQAYQQSFVKNNDTQDSYTPDNEATVDELFEMYENGQISKEEFKRRVVGKKSSDDPISLINRTPESMNTTPELQRKEGENKGDGKRKTYGSYQASSIFSKEFKDEVKTDTFIQKYATITNEGTLLEAATELDEGGEARVKEWWALKPNRASVVDIAMGIILMDRYQRVGDTQSQIAAAQKLSEMGTASGQAVQIFSILRRFDPAAMLAYAQKSMDDAYKTLVETKSKRWLEKHADDLRLTEEDIEFIFNRTIVAAGMPDGRSKDIMIAQIAQRLQDKLPPEKGQTMRALQRISMLLNPKTIGRNILGNVVITPVHWISDWIGTPLDKMLSIASKVRTKSGIADIKENAKAFGRGFIESYEDLVNKVNTQANLDRFEISQKGAKSFYEGGKLKGLAKMMNAMDRFTSFTLAVGDRPFYEYWFVRSINSQMKANKVDMPTEEMIAIATQEALERTWQDTNMATKVVSGLKRVLNIVSLDNLIAGKETGGYGLGDVLIKFTKTPANLTKAIFDFSPAGFATASRDAVRFVKAVKSGKDVAMAQRNFVKSFSNAAAGTLLYVIAFALYNAGRLTGSSDEDKDVAAFEKWVQGVPAYSVKGFDGKWYSYEWMQPVGSIAAIVSDYMQNKEADMSTFASINEAFKTGGTILYNQSFLQSFQKLFTADNIWEGFLDSLYSDPSAFVPQVMSQTASLLDDKRRVTFDKTDPLKSALNSIMYKIPGLRNKLQADVDVFGRPVPNSQNNVFDAFLNPANTYVDTSDEVTNHVYALYKELGNKAMIPAKAPYSITVGDKTIDLTPEQRAEYQTIMGTVAYKIIDRLLDSELYNSYSSAEKEVIIKDVYAYANKVALGNYDAEYTFEMARKDNKYMTRAKYDQMSSEEKKEAYRRGVLSGYSSILDTDEDGVIAYYENRAVKTAVTDALEYYDVDKAKELIEIAKANVPKYSSDPEETTKSMISGIKSNVTMIWKYQYQIAYYENDTERMEQIRQMLVDLGLYGKSSDVRKTLREWLEESEEAKNK